MYTVLGKDVDNHCEHSFDAVHGWRRPEVELREPTDHLDQILFQLLGDSLRVWGVREEPDCALCLVEAEHVTVEDAQLHDPLHDLGLPKGWGLD